MTEKLKTEHEEQREFVSWFRKTYKGVRIFAIPNGGARSPSQAARLKVEGVSAGVPDLFIPEFSTWVEMKKTKVGRPSNAQLDWIEYLINKCAHKAIIAAGCNDAKEQLLVLMQKELNL